MDIVKIIFYLLVLIFFTFFIGKTTITVNPFSINITNIYAPIILWVLIVINYLIIIYKK